MKYNEVNELIRKHHLSDHEVDNLLGDLCLCDIKEIEYNAKSDTFLIYKHSGLIICRRRCDLNAK